MQVTNKFGGPVATLPGQRHCDLSVRRPTACRHDTPRSIARRLDRRRTAASQAMRKRLFVHFRDALPAMDYDRLRWFVDELAAQTAQKHPALGIETLTLAIDRRYPTGDKKRSSVLTIVRGGLERIFQAQPLCDEPSQARQRLTYVSPA